VLVDVHDLLGALAGRADEKRSFDGRLNLDQLADVGDLGRTGTA